MLWPNGEDVHSGCFHHLRDEAVRYRRSPVAGSISLILFGGRKNFCNPVFITKSTAVVYILLMFWDRFLKYVYMCVYVYGYIWCVCEDKKF